MLEDDDFGNFDDDKYYDYEAREASVYNEKFPFCCGAFLVGDFDKKELTEKDILKITTEADRVRTLLYGKPGLGVLTVQQCTPDMLHVLAKHGWEELKTWRSNHGPYPITMFAKTYREYIEPAPKVKKVLTRKAKDFS